jgi:hypothetical protein
VTSNDPTHIRTRVSGGRFGASLTEAPGSTLPGLESRPITVDEVVRYQLRHPAQVPFSATLPDAMLQVIE